MCDIADKFPLSEAWATKVDRQAENLTEVFTLVWVRQAGVTLVSKYMCAH